MGIHLAECLIPLQVGGECSQCVLSGLGGGDAETEEVAHDNAEGREDEDAVLPSVTVRSSTLFMHAFT